FANVPEQEAAPSAKIWSDIFEALANVNNALFYLPQLEAKYPKQVDELRMYRAEMLALRALAHFDLCRAYAQPYTYTNGATHLGVPVLRQTPGPDDVVKRGSVQQVYDLIVSDLEEAEKIYSTNTFVRAVNQ